jgi:hypothetical protein
MDVPAATHSYEDLPMNDGPDLSVEMAAYYRQILVTHANNPETGVCMVCGIPRCPDWTNGYDTLATAGQVMTTAPPPWQPFRPRSKPTTTTQPPRSKGQA